VRAEPPVNTDKLNKKIEGFTLTDVRGKKVALADYRDRKAVVIVFLSFECPVSNSYVPELNRLAKDCADQGVALLAVACGDEPAASLAKQADEFKLAFPLLCDPQCMAADALKAETTPEAFLLDHNHVLRYRGRIDNTWAARLRRNQQTTRHDLRAALDELLAGKDVRVPATRAIGCPLGGEKAVAKSGTVTYHRDVLPILQNHCQSCHRPGEVGPFSLMTYKQAVNWASDIKDYTQSRKMPPWKPVAGPAFHNERKLTEKEIATLAAWADGGTPEGDPKDAPAPKQFTEGWQLGKPDLVLTVPEEMVIGPSGKDLFRVFVLPTRLPEDKYITAIDVRPGNKRVVHHTLNFIDRTGKARELEEKEKKREKKAGEQDRGPGYSVSMGVGFLPQGGLGGWAPGQMARELPEGTGYLLPRGADVVVQVHYHRNGREERDRLTIGLYFARKPVKSVFQGMVIPGRFLWVPANDPAFKVKGAIEVLQDCTLHSVMPHMHMLGKQIQVTLTPPEGQPTTLVAIRDWDYNWQETYFLQKPIAIKAGTRMQVEAVYDNTDKNPNNPFNPPRLVTFGEQTDNEMCFVFLGATSDRPGRIRFRAEGQRPRPAAEQSPEKK
jgi:peroxiredoxin/mono/diheme cytochrome c family protein